MTAHLARALISLSGLVGAGVVFMAMEVTWLSIAACVMLIVGSGLIAEWVFRQLADGEARKRDLEDRLRNTPG